MTAGGDETTRTPVAIWCGTCGIPYAPETVYCANCGATLAPLADEVADATPLPPASAGSLLPTTPETAAPGAPQPVDLAMPGPQPPLADTTHEELSTPHVADSPPVAPFGRQTLDEAFPRPPRTLLDRVSQRQRAMSESEIDAAAAAIIAQARRADRHEAATGAPVDAPPPFADLAPDPVVVAALQRRRDRDRAWLIGGIVCCVLLIVLALVISRTMSVGMLRQ